MNVKVNEVNIRNNIKHYMEKSIICVYTISPSMAIEMLLHISTVSNAVHIFVGIVLRNIENMIILNMAWPIR